MSDSSPTVWSGIMEFSSLPTTAPALGQAHCGVDSVSVEGRAVVETVELGLSGHSGIGIKLLCFPSVLSPDVFITFNLVRGGKAGELFTAHGLFGSDC